MSLNNDNLPVNVGMGIGAGGILAAAGAVAGIVYPPLAIGLPAASSLLAGGGACGAIYNAYKRFFNGAADTVRVVGFEVRNTVRIVISNSLLTLSATSLAVFNSRIRNNLKDCEDQPESFIATYVCIHDGIFYTITSAGVVIIFAAQAGLAYSYLKENFWKKEEPITPIASLKSNGETRAIKVITFGDCALTAGAVGLGAAAIAATGPVGLVAKGVYLCLYLGSKLLNKNKS